MTKKKHILLANLAAVAGGLALFAAFPPIGIWPMAILGIALVVGSLEGRTWFGSLWLGTLAGGAFFFPLFEWARVASGEIIAQVGLATAEALFIGIMAIVWQGLMRGGLGTNSVVRACTLGLTWVAFEHLRSMFPFGGMPWGVLAFSQVDGPLIRLAPWGSVMLVGFVLVFVSVLLERAVVNAFTGGIGRAIVAVACGGALLFAPTFLPLASKADRYITVGFAQGIVPREGELPSGQSQALTVTENLGEATKKLTEDVDVVFWPESASDRDPREDSTARELIQESADSLGVPLVLGTQSYPGENRYNEYVVWMPDGEIVDSYSKQHPVPFGEYMPYRDFFRRFTPAVDLVSIDMLAGSEPAVVSVPLDSGELRVATPICFEVATTHIVAEAVSEGAELIVVPTNNASFGTTAESRQQFDMTRFRAVEHGRTAIQVSTVGVSGVVEPNGVLREVTEPWSEDARSARVGLRTELTFATRAAEALCIGVYVLGAGLSAVALRQLWHYRRSRVKGDQ
ncbi:apolipoprotein N-acyltransferase [Actinomycetaceae bacterium L2_0104]